MKKILCLILLLSLFLTACGSPTPTTEKESIVPTESLNPGSEPAQPEETTAPTEAYVPQGNVTVDFSVYEKGESTYVPSLYTIPAGGIDGNLPLSAPTTLYPYAGAIARNYYGYVEERLYGLADSKGTLITAPIYNSIELLRDFVTGNTLPFWVISIAELEVYYFEDGSEYPYADTKYGIVSMDGTFYLDCVYDDISLCGDRILCVRNNETSNNTYSAESYDAQGNLRFSIADPDFGTPVKIFYCSYREGHYLLRLTEDMDNPNEYDGLYYFASEAGQILYGPYHQACDFEEGMAVVSLDGELYQFLRTDGTMLPGTYKNAISFRNGIATVTKDDPYFTTAIDQNGNELFTEKGSQYYTYDGALIIRDYGNYTSACMITCYDNNGNVLWRSDDDTLDVLTKDLVRYYDDNNTILRSMSTGKEMEFPEYTYIEYIDHPTDPYMVVYASEQENGIFTHYILTTDMEFFAELPSPWANLDEQVNNSATGNMGFSVRNGDQVTIYESPNNIVGTYTVDEFKSATLCPDGTVSFVTDEWGALYDKNGKIFFRYGINAMED